MTLESTQNQNRYIGNGSTKSFAFTFKVWKKSEVAVWVGDGLTESEVSATCSITITASGGTVTFRSAPKSGTVIVIRRSMPYVQQDDYRNGSRFDAEDVEDRLDQDCAERQDLRLDIGRALKLPITSDMTADELIQTLLQAIQELREAGDVSGSSLVKATGTETYRPLADRFADVVNVLDYGAKGDGSDDSAAIQAALNTGKDIFFPFGTYGVGTTLETTVPYQDVDLNGSTLVWAGENGGGPIADAATEGSTIKNGFLEGAGDGTKAETALKVSGFKANAQDLVIKGFTDTAILLEKPSGPGGSLAATLHNIFITAGDGNGLFSLPGGPTGLRMNSHDNQISNCTILRMNKSVYFAQSGGNAFVNCHLCAMYPTGTQFTTESGIANSYALYYDLNVPHAYYENVFTNCYFDNHKYVVYNVQSNYYINQFANCFAFYSAAWFATGAQGLHAHMCGGHYSQINSKLFSIQCGSYVSFFDALVSCGSYDAFDFSGEEYCKSNFSGSYNQTHPFLAQFRVNNNQPVRVVRAGQDSASTVGQPCVIGGIMLPGSESDNLYRFTQATLKINNRGYSYLEVFLWYQGGTIQWSAKTNHLTSDNFKIKIGSPEEVVINGNTSLFIPIYIVPKSDLSNSVFWASLELQGNMVGYLVSSGNQQNWSSDTFICEIDPADYRSTYLPYYGDGSAVTDFNSLTVQGTYRITWTSTTSNYPEVRETDATDGVLEVFRLGSASGVSSVSRIVQRVTVGSTGSTWVRAQTGDSAFAAWKEMTASE